MATMLVTGSSGLIGSEVVSYFSALGWSVHGADNNMRADLFGPEGDTIWNRRRLEVACPGFVHHEVDIRDRAVCADLMAALLPEVVVHAAAQPSHDLRPSAPSTISTSTRSALSTCSKPTGGRALIRAFLYS